MKKKKIIVTTLIIIAILMLVGTRQYRYDQIEDSAKALNIRLEEVGMWPTFDEMQQANNEVKKAIEDLQRDAERANIDVEEITKDAATQSEAIYLVQDTLKEAENIKMEIRKNKKFPKLNTIIHILVPII